MAFKTLHSVSHLEGSWMLPALLLFCPDFPVLHLPHLELQLVSWARQAGRGTLRAPEYGEALSFPEFPGNSGCLLLKDPSVLEEALPVPEWRPKLWGGEAGTEK